MGAEEPSGRSANAGRTFSHVLIRLVKRVAAKNAVIHGPVLGPKNVLCRRLLGGQSIHTRPRLLLLQCHRGVSIYDA